MSFSLLKIPARPPRIKAEVTSKSPSLASTRASTALSYATKTTCRWASPMHCWHRRTISWSILPSTGIWIIFTLTIHTYLKPLTDSCLLWLWFVCSSNNSDVGLLGVTLNAFDVVDIYRTGEINTHINSSFLFTSTRVHYASLCILTYAHRRDNTGDQCGPQLAKDWCHTTVRGILSPVPAHTL